MKSYSEQSSNKTMNLKKIAVAIMLASALGIFAFSVYYFVLRRNLSVRNPTESNFQAVNEKPRLVVLVSLDGLGSNLISTSNTPYLESLMNKDNVSHTLSLQTLEQSETLPSHVSMVTGLTQEHHGVAFNSITELTPLLDHETVFDYADGNGYKYVVFLSKGKLEYLLGGKTGENILVDEVASTAAMTELDNLVEPTASDEFVFIHFRDADTSGHSFGWGSPEQVEAIQQLDSNLESLFMDLSQEFSAYERYYVVTADHGGEGTQHSNGCISCRAIPLIVVSENTEVKYSLDDGYNNIYDVSCLVIDLLEVEVPKNIDCN